MHGSALRTDQGDSPTRKGGAPSATADPNSSSSASDKHDHERNVTLPPVAAAAPDDRYSASESARLPAVSHARAIPPTMSSPANHTPTSQHPHPQPLRQMSSSNYSQAPPGYPPSNGAMMSGHVQGYAQSAGYAPQQQQQSQQGYATSPATSSVPAGGAQYANYSNLPSPVLSYPPSAGGRVVYQPSTHAYGNYPIAYGPPAQQQSVSRVAQSPTTIQSPASSTAGRYSGGHPGSAELAPAATPGGVPQKRKRKSMGEKAGESPEDDGGSGSEVERALTSGSAADRMSKRTKTQRACDPCRRKKIRCDILPESEPPVCQHCKQYGFECTFFLPITETRFKKKRELEEQAKQKDSQDEGGDSQSPATKETPRTDVKIYGPTSLAYLMHATNNLPHHVYKSYDTRWNYSLTVGAGGNGFIHVTEPDGQVETDEEGAIKQEPLPVKLDRQILEALINSYFLEVAPYFPVLTREEFVEHVRKNSNDTFLTYAVAIGGACLRKVSQEVFESIRATLNHVMRTQDTLSCSTITNVQGLLIMQTCFDTHATFVTNPGTANYLRTGTAIRMAQDLGLHRAEAVKEDLHRRRRVWACCLVADRWIAAAMGHPFLIDRLDCDVRLPAEEPLNAGSIEPRPLAYLAHMVQLAILYGDVMKIIYGPTGIDRAQDEELIQLLARLDEWKARLPHDLQFSVDTKSSYAGVLHMMHTAIMVVFWRPFMRITYACPSHIKFSLTVERWSALVKSSEEAIVWFTENAHVWDSWWVVSYCLTSVCLCLFQTWSRRKDGEAAEYMRMLRETVNAWENSCPPSHMKSRRKNAEIIVLLHEATKSGRPKMEKAILNPTTGVGTRFDATPMVFKKDSSRPGGGVYVLEKDTDLEKHKDLPPGTFLIKQGSVDDTTSSDHAQSSNMPPTVTVTLPNFGRPEQGGAAHGFVSGSQMSGGLQLGGDADSGILTPGGMPNLNPSLSMPEPGVQQVQLLNPLGQDLSDLDTVSEYTYVHGLPGTLADWENWGAYFNRYGFPGGQQSNIFPFVQDGQGSSSGSGVMDNSQGPPRA